MSSARPPPRPVSNSRTDRGPPASKEPTLSGPTRARAEWHRLDEVIIHRPGVEMFFGLLEPYSFLYERAFRIDEATYEHETLEHALRESGVTVRRLIHLAIELGSRHPELVERVRHEIHRIVRYTGPAAMVDAARAALRRNLDTFDGETLFNILLLRPSIRLARRPGVRVILPKVELDTPLANLYFMRDQQGLSANGYVMGRMSKPQRRNEPLLTGALLRAWGARFAGEVRSPGTFEGGDFMPMGEFVLLGHGDRTNASGVRQILRMDLGVDTVAVVHQPTHPAIPGNDPDPMIDMHLDTYLNVPGEGLVVGCAPLLDRARVDVYRRRAGGRIVRASAGRPLREFFAERKIEVVPISTLEQMSYASNFLCLRDRKILAVEVEAEVDRVLNGLATAARRNPHRYGALLTLVRKERQELRQGRGFFPHIADIRDRSIEVVPLALQEITGGYGGAHCMTCVTRRTSP
ncbi:MAG TPA: arginine deiminase family protein [Thermoplasmata archaeon]|nr:arginine deiminase family protein [Thermoplasmata archaeon]